MVFKYFCLSIAILVIGVGVFVFLNLPQDRFKYENYNYGRGVSKLVEHFDFIIIGGGSAGSVLANRLSKNPNITVLLLEAGESDTDLRIKIPAAFCQNFNTAHDWGYESIPQKNKGNKTVFLPRGKTMGGSSSINAMIYIRGSAWDYDEWARMGFKNWSYDNLLPYFKKSERQQRSKDLIDTNYHGFEGEWQIEDVHRHPVSEIIVDAFHKELNLSHCSDFNGEKFQKEGIGFNQVNTANGQRNSLSDAFLNSDVLKRKNLYVRTGVLVTRILFEKNVAIGIEYEEYADASRKNKVFAKKELILSAGAYNTPQILQLSGIGEKKLLEELGIPVVLNNPEVGKNMEDHPIMGLIFKVKDHIETFDKVNRFPYNILSILEWLGSRNNLLKSNIAEVNGFIRSPYAKRNNITAPDFQIVGSPVVFLDHGRKTLPVNGGLSYGIIMLNPKSRGTVEIQSNNPRQPPKIDPNMFGESEDFERFYEMLLELKKVKENEKLKELVDYQLILKLEKATKEEIIEAIYEHTFLLYHPTGTAAMGKVVDERLNVFNIKKLRIVDASVMPTITRGNTNAPTVVIAEKASDIILEDHSLMG
jgi:choline dehydrogenase